MNNYEILGIPNNSSLDDVRKRYYVLAKEYHPDRTNNDIVKAEKFLKIKTAYEELLKGISNTKPKFESQSKSQTYSYSYSKGSYLINDIKYDKYKKTYLIYVNLANVKYVEISGNKYYIGKYIIDGNFNGRLVVTKEDLKRSDTINIKIVDYNSNYVNKSYRIRKNFFSKLYTKIITYLDILFFG